MLQRRFPVPVPRSRVPDVCVRRSQAVPEKDLPGLPVRRLRQLPEMTEQWPPGDDEVFEDPWYWQDDDEDPPDDDETDLNAAQ